VSGSCRITVTFDNTQTTEKKSYTDSEC